MSWSDVHQLAVSGVEIDGHGVEHEPQHATQPKLTREAELSGSKSRIESQTRRPCNYFAFPGGAMNAESSGEAAAAGYQLAFSTRSAPIRAGDDKFALPRIEPGGTRERMVARLRGPEATILRTTGTT
jgi:peptidoglycan/xylan/chitin deacetylase (PgdA/CDA1 family)